jgi:hypothetical protein
MSKNFLLAARMEFQRVSVAQCGLELCKVLQGFWSEKIEKP